MKPATIMKSSGLEGRCNRPSIKGGLHTMHGFKRAFKASILFAFVLNSSAYAQHATVFVSDATGKYGVRNDKGETIIPAKYASILLLSDGSLLAHEEDPGWPMIMNEQGEVLVSKTNYIGRVLDAFDGHFICQYYRDGQLADLVLFKAPDLVLFNFPSTYVHAEFVKDSCYTYVSAQTATPGEKLMVDLGGKALTGPGNVHFDHIKNLFKPCNGYAVVLKDNGYDGILCGVYDLNNQKMIIPCGFSDIEFDEKAGLIKAYDKVRTLTYDLYDTSGHLVKTWEQIGKQ